MNEIQIVWDGKKEVVASAAAVVRRWRQGHAIQDVKVLWHRRPDRFWHTLQNRLGTETENAMYYALEHPPG